MVKLSVFRANNFLLSMGACLSVLLSQQAGAAINLADSPVLSPVSMPGNLVLALSVEYPTASTAAYPDSGTTAYSTAVRYLGNFDSEKCYRYVAVVPVADSYFAPNNYASNHLCSTGATALWSGNYLNWASTQTLDAFRWALTGGTRKVDTATETILQKTRNAGQQPVNDKTLGSADVAGATPFSSWTSVISKTYIGSPGLGYAMRVGATTTGTLVDYAGQSTAAGTANAGRTYVLYMNVKVCDSTVGVESNCKQYGTNYKPEGLLQQYAMKLRYSAFGYLNDISVSRDGGVMRARMKYVGPQQPVPGVGSIANLAAEWDANTGIMATNPDSADATATTAASAAAGYSVTISNSGVLNYLSKFGNIATGDYKPIDPVSELYYAGLRYLRNLTNLDQYSSLAGAGSVGTMTRWLDGFPVITAWTDPILYACQSNFILGIGDVNTHRDANLFGAALINTAEETSVKPTDVGWDVTASTNMVGSLEGAPVTANVATWISTGRKDTYYMAGLAYQAHSQDIRADLPGKQTVATYWLDVLENQSYASKNQYYLAAKYGGFVIPNDPNLVTYTYGSPLGSGNSWWHTPELSAGLDVNRTPASGSAVPSATSDLRPDNYFVANQADKMVAGLTAAFADIAARAGSTTTTGFSFVSPNVKSTGNVSYAAAYEAATWTGSMTASRVSYDIAGNPTLTQVWDARDALNQRTAASRYIVTCCLSGWTSGSGAAYAGIPFTVSALGATTFSRTNYASFANVVLPATSSSSSSLTSSAAASSRAAQYLAYLRGDRSKEITSSSSSSSVGVYRARAHLLGDIVNAKLVTVGPPASPYYDIYNPKYSDFKKLYRSRKTVVYVASNDGMLHAFDGSVASSSASSSSSAVSSVAAAPLSSSSSSSAVSASSASSSAVSSCGSGGQCGYELFAYIPSFVYGDAVSAPVTGLASLGNGTGTYSHHFMVDETPQDFDVDFSMVGGPIPGPAPDWHTLLIGGLGKGGKGYYALDITDPASWTSEALIATKVIWEFTDPNMGYSFGPGAIVKTKRWGWVTVLTSGYNNADNQGHIFFVNPKNGALLEDVKTTAGSASSPVNFSQATAYIPNERDWTADAIYVGDVGGKIWRLDVSGTGPYVAPLQIATLSAPPASAAASSSSSSSASSSSAASTGQSVTIWPLLAVDPASKKRYVVVGTGRMLAVTDIPDTQTQSIYAIVDGKSSFGGFYTGGPGGTLPVGVNFPITRIDLNNNPNLLTGIGASPTKVMGWYHDLPDSAAAASSATSSAASSSSSSSSSSSASSTGSERIHTPPAYADGMVGFSVNSPAGDICDNGGAHRTLVFALATGKSLLYRNGVAVATTGISPGLGNDLKVITHGGKRAVTAGDTNRGVQNVELAPLQFNSKQRRLNWRELPTAD